MKAPKIGAARDRRIDKVLEFLPRRGFPRAHGLFNLALGRRTALGVLARRHHL
jgi:hypothetical protein